MKVEKLYKINYFEELILSYVERSLPIKYRNVNVRLVIEDVSNYCYADVNGYLFKILYFPTGRSAADRPKKLPDSALEKLKKLCRNNLNGVFTTIESYDRFLEKNIEITHFRLHSLKLTKTHQRKIGAFIERNVVKDFFNY